MISTLLTYDSRNKRVSVFFMAIDTNGRVTLSQTANLTLEEADRLRTQLNETLDSIPPEPRTVSAEDLGL